MRAFSTRSLRWKCPLRPQKRLRPLPQNSAPNLTQCGPGRTLIGNAESVRGGCSVQPGKTLELLPEDVTRLVSAADLKVDCRLLEDVAKCVANAETGEGHKFTLQQLLYVASWVCRNDNAVFRREYIIKVTAFRVQRELLDASMDLATRAKTVVAAVLFLEAVLPILCAQGQTDASLEAVLRGTVETLLVIDLLRTLPLRRGLLGLLSVAQELATHFEWQDVRAQVRTDLLSILPTIINETPVDDLIVLVTPWHADAEFAAHIEGILLRVTQDFSAEGELVPDIINGTAKLLQSAAPRCDKKLIHGVICASLLVLNEMFQNDPTFSRHILPESVLILVENAALSPLELESLPALTTLALMKCAYFDAHQIHTLVRSCRSLAGLGTEGLLRKIAAVIAQNTGNGKSTFGDQVAAFTDDDLICLLTDLRDVGLTSTRVLRPFAAALLEPSPVPGGNENGPLLRLYALSSTNLLRVITVFMRSRTVGSVVVTKADDALRCRAEIIETGLGNNATNSSSSHTVTSTECRFPDDIVSVCSPEFLMVLREAGASQWNCNGLKRFARAILRSCDFATIDPTAALELSDNCKKLNIEVPHLETTVSKICGSHSHSGAQFVQPEDAPRKKYIMRAKAYKTVRSKKLTW